MKPATAKPGTNQEKVNRSTPASSRARLGDAVADLIAQVNAQGAALAALTAKHNAVCAKLDADAGVTDVNYVSLTGATAFSATTVKDLESR